MTSCHFGGWKQVTTVDLMLHVVVFTILCKNLLKIYSLPFGNVLPKLWNKAVGESEVLPQLRRVLYNISPIRIEMDSFHTPFDHKATTS